MSIPKRIFFFWGNTKLSWMRYMTLKSFRLLNPDWQMILYTSKNRVHIKTWIDDVEQDFFAYEGEDYMPKVQELNIEIHPFELKEITDIGSSHLSNFLKWHKLQAHGGVYADMDILWCRKFDELFDLFKDHDSAICATHYLSIGLLGSTIGNRMFRDFYSNALHTFDPNRYQCVGVESIYRLLYGDEIIMRDKKVDWGFLYSRNIIQDLRDRWPEITIANIPFGMIYPFSCTEVESIFEESYNLPENVVGIHWYAGHPIAQKYNKLLSDKTYSHYNNTFTKVACRYA